MNFLPTLEDEKFENLSSSFQELEESKKILEEFQEDKKLIFSLNALYNIYNQALLYNKYQEYIKKDNEYKEANKNLLEIKDKYLKTEKKYEDILSNLDILEKNIISYKSQIDLLNEAKEIKDNKEFEKKLNIIKDDLRTLNKEFKEHNYNILKKKNEVTQIMTEINKTEDKKRKNKSQRGILHRELNDQNIEIKFAGHLSPNEYESVGSKTMKDKLILSKKEVVEYKDKILETARLLKDYEILKIKFSDLEEKVEEIKKKLQSINLEIDKLENQKETRKKKFY